MTVSDLRNLYNEGPVLDAVEFYETFPGEVPTLDAALEQLAELSDGAYDDNGNWLVGADEQQEIGSADAVVESALDEIPDDFTRGSYGAWLRKSDL